MPHRYQLPGPNFLPAFFPGNKGSMFGDDPRLDDLPPETIGVVHAIPIIPQSAHGGPRPTDTTIRAYDFQSLETTLAEYRGIRGTGVTMMKSGSSEGFRGTEVQRYRKEGMESSHFIPLAAQTKN